MSGHWTAAAARTTWPLRGCRGGVSPRFDLGFYYLGRRRSAVVVPDLGPLFFEGARSGTLETERSRGLLSGRCRPLCSRCRGPAR
jgi:hypothetical protein